MIQSEVQYKVYPQRFIVTTLYILVQFMTAVLVNTFTPIAAYLAIIYQQDPLYINLAGLLFVLMHPIFTFPAAYFIDTYGSRVGISIGCVLCIIGVSIRLLINQHFYFAILGQIIAGIGRPFILNCQTKISAGWYSASSRGTVTQILTLILNVSLIVGIFIPGLVFKHQNFNPENIDIQLGKQLAYKTMLVQAIMGYVCYTLNILFQKEKPPSPPSASSTVVKEPFSIAIPKLFKNKNYIFMLIGFGCFFGIFNGLSVVLSFLVEPWFRGDDLPIVVGVVGGSPIISGIIGVTVFGPMQKRSKVYKKWILICMIGSSSAMIIFYPLLQTGSLLWTSFASAYNSFFLIPLVPIMLEFGCQLGFPVGQGTITGLMFAMGNLFGFFLGMILSVIVQGQTKGQTAGGLGFCFGIFLIGFLFVYLLKQKLNRSDYESVQSGRKSGVFDTKGIQMQAGKDQGNLQINLLQKSGKQIENLL